MVRNRRFTRAAAAVAAASVLSVWTPSALYDLGLASSSAAYAATNAPTGLRVDVGNTKIYPSWSANSDVVTGYEITYVPYGTLGGLLVALGGQAVTSTVSATSTSTVITGLTNGSPYDVSIKAIYAGNVKSSASTTVTVRPTATTPAQPTLSTATAGDSKVTLNWLAGTDTLRKRIDVYRDGVAIAAVTPPTTTYVDTTALNDTTYSYQLVAVDDSGSPSVRSEPSAAKTATPVDTTPPAAPQNVVVTPGDRTAALSWAANVEPDLHHYQVVGNGVNVSVLAGTNGWATSGLTNGTTYTFTVSAVDKKGNSSGATSVTVKPADSTAPDVPTNLVARSADSALDASWTGSAATDTNAYRVYVGGSLFTTVPAGTTSIHLQPLTNGTSYDVRFSAVDYAGNESAKTGASFGTPADTTAPAAPTGVLGVAGDSSAVLTWNASPESDVARYLVVSAAGSTVATVPVGTNTATLTGLTNGVASTYSVKAADRTGNVSPASSTVTVMPRDTTPPSVPTAVRAVAGDSSVTVSWIASPESDVDHYDVRDLSGTVRGTVGSAATSATIIGLQNDVQASFVVVAVDRAGNASATSATVSATPRDMTAPSAPTHVVGVSGDSAGTVAWTASPESDVARYLVRNAAGTVVATVPAGTTSATIIGLANGSTSSYTVVAVDLAGNVSTAGSAVTLAPHDLTPPSPSAQVSSLAGDTTVAVTWTPSPEADVDHYLVVDAAGTTRASTLASQTSVVVNGLTNGTAYTFSVVAVDTAGNRSLPSAAPAATPVRAPLAVPTAVGGTAADGLATVTWTGVSDARVVGYDVCSTPAGPSGACSSVVAGVTTAGFPGLTNGTDYTFIVYSVDAAGNRSAASSTVTLTPRSAAPVAPTGVTATPANSSAVVTWNPVSGASTYEVITSDGRIVSASGTSVTVAGLTNGTTYTVAVQAVTADGTRGTLSGSVSVTPAAPVTAPPAAPTGVTATPGNTTAAVAWNAVPGAASYEVVTSDGRTIPVSGTSTTVTGLTNGTAYGVQVRALAGDGTPGTLSNSVTVTPVAPAAPVVPGAPTGVTATPGNAAAVLSWNAVPGAASYEVITSDGRTVTASGTGLTLTGLTNGTPYGVQVRAVAGDGTRGTLSITVTVTPAAPSTAPPAAGAGSGGGSVTSADGRITVFATAAKLESSDTNTYPELYVRDNTTGIATRVDAAAAGTDLATSQLALSADGRYLAVVTTVGKVGADTNKLADVYRVDLQTKQWQLVSVPVTGATSATAGTVKQTGARVVASSPSLAISADGTKVFFFSDRNDLVAGDTNKATDLFAKDVTTGDVTRVSTTAVGGQLSYGVQGPALDVTPDGRYVVFAAKAVNVVMAWRKDLQTGALDAVSGTGAWPSSGTAYAVATDAHDLSVSDDGRYVAFLSSNTVLTKGATEYLAYRRDMSGATRPVRAGMVAQSGKWEQQPTLDPTGRFVFFATAANSGADTDGHTDWYRYDVDTNSLVQVTTTAGRTPATVKMTGSVTAAEYGAITVRSADEVLVSTMQALVPTDTNKVTDIYRKVISTGAVGSAV